MGLELTEAEFDASAGAFEQEATTRHWVAQVLVTGPRADAHRHRFVDLTGHLPTVLRDTRLDIRMRPRFEDSNRASSAAEGRPM